MSENMENNKTGKNVFEKLDKKIQSGLSKLGVKEPTLVQELSFGPILNGLNCLLISETGTGKTLGAFLPIFHLWLEHKPKPVSILYISPLKSLNRDMIEHLIHWGEKLEMEVTVRHGDTSAYERKQQVEFPNDMMIVTLETLQPLLVGKKIRELLRNVKWVVLDECLPYESLVTINDGSQVMIGEIVEENLKDGYSSEPKKDIFVKSVDTVSGDIIKSRVSKVYKIPLNKEIVYIRTKLFNKELSATSDHLFLVKRNKKLVWIEAEDLKQHDKLLIHNPLEDQIEETKIKKKDKRIEIINEEVFRRNYLELFPSSTSKNQGGKARKLEKIIESLKSKQILPLYSDTEMSKILSRIIGHIMGDGWLTITDKTVASGFSASEIDLSSIKSDLLKLGFSFGRAHVRNSKSTITSSKNKDIVVEGVSIQNSNGSKTLAALLYSLGVSRGEKTDQKYRIPKWIFTNKELEKEFLSAFFGSELYIPRGRKYLDFDAPRLSIYKREDMIKEGMKLAEDIKKILKDFDITISNIKVSEGNLRKDGTRTKKILITISNNEDNLIRLFSRIGISYNSIKSESGRLIVKYLLSKKFARYNRMKLANKIRELESKGMKPLEIVELLGFDIQLNLKGRPHGNRPYNIMQSILDSTKHNLIGFPDFNQWKKLCVGDCIADEIAVVKKDRLKRKFVYDISVEGAHNFLANDIVVHNCHEIADSKRGVQLTLALERLKQLCGDFQLIMLSATVGDPEKVANFFSGGKPIKIIKAYTTKQMDIKVISPKTELKDKKIAEKIFSSDETAARLRTIMELIENSKSTLTFTNTREFAEILASRIKTLDKKFPVEIHHSSLSKEVRIKAEKELKEEKLKSLIATSSLQLGIDIGSIDQVIQYQSPRQVTQLIQRVGRSGHELSRISKGIIVSTDDDDIFESAVIARKALANELEESRFHENSLDVLAHQIIGLTFDFGKIELGKAYEVFKRSYPYRNLSYEEFLEVCRQLERIGLIFLDGYVKKRSRGFDYYFSQLSTIPDTKQYKVFNTLDKTFVGVLDEEFVALHGEENTTFIMKGSAWRIISVEEDRVLVEPTEDVEAAIPGWEGELIPVPYDVSQEVGRLRSFIKEEMIKKKSDKEIEIEILGKYPVDENCAEEMVRAIRKQLKQGVVPDDKTMLVEDFENIVIIHSCFGTQVNETIGRFLTALLTSRVGSVGLKTDPYRIILQFQQKNVELIKEVLFNTKPEYFRSYLEMSLGKSELFEWKFVHVAKRFGVISRGAELGKVRMRRIVEDYIGSPVYKETMKELEKEKLDIDRALDVIERIQKKEIAVLFKPGMSYLGKIGIKHKYAEVVGPEKPELEIFELFKQRLMNTKIRMVCINCGQWDQTFVVKELPNDLKCKKCEARLIAPLRFRGAGVTKLIKKGLRSLSSLTAEEKKRYENIKQRGDLYLVYRNNAAKALAGIGIGPQTAKRVLAKYHKTEDDLLRDILQAEREFTRTKKYWRV